MDTSAPMGLWKHRVFRNGTASIRRFWPACAPRTTLCPGFRGALVWLEGGLKVACGCLPPGYQVAWGSHEGGLGVALWWLCGGFVLRSLCLVYA
jgi:hypothetical protein